MTGRVSGGLEARAVALDLLGTVLERRTPLDEALQHHKRFPSLESRDRAFARNLVATSLRRLGQLDAVIARLLERPLKPKTETLRQVLRLGLCQILFLETPPHAAVDTSVRLAAKAGFAGHKGLVNAVLRRADRELRPLIAGQAASGEAGRLNTPDWLWDALSAAYGEAAAQAIAAAHLTEPPLDLTLKDPTSADDWAARLDARILPTGSLRLPPGQGDVTKLAGYREGAWWVQDLAASLPARLLRAPAGRTMAGQTVVDLCAAPGGKTVQLAAAGAEAIAVDRDAGRLKRLSQNLDRLGLRATTVEADATRWRPPAPVAAVLLDAPCSATGTLRRHPDIAWLKGPKQIAPLAQLQDRLLAAAADMLEPGGQLVYATCSLLPEEGPARIAALLDGGAPFARDPIAGEEIADLGELITAAGDLRSLPSQLSEIGGLDGFYVCRLRRQ
jgi:16S rRNA (cytosine967-C5)-methyltransferase